MSQLIRSFLAAHALSHSRLISDSRQIRAGDVFIAYPGQHTDGRQFIEQAIQRGACAVIYEAQAASTALAGLINDTPQLAIPNLKSHCSALAAEFYGHPAAHLWNIAVTGTNGKTSCSQWIAQCLQSLGRRCAILGTLGQGFPGELHMTQNTTPDALDIQAFLQQAVQQGAVAQVMEASSIGLDQGRVDAVPYQVALFTNLSRDHLDYHGTMENYAAAKARLFGFTSLRSVVLNLNDPAAKQMAAAVAPGCQIVGYRIAALAGEPLPSWCQAYLQASALNFTAQGVRFQLHSSWGEAQVLAPVIGQYNVSNLLGVLGALLTSGVEMADALRVLTQIQPVPGRMEPVQLAERAQPAASAQLPLVIVDYAHSPDALEKCLQALQAIAVQRAGRLLCAFGCGGERDAGKRPLMGAVAAAYCQQIILTNDNPRFEDAQEILQQIRRGVPGHASCEVIPDRAQAIVHLIQAAQPADVILLAGKGHEDYQEIAGVRVPFSDRDAAQHALQRWYEKSIGNLRPLPAGFMDNLQHLAQTLSQARVQIAEQATQNVMCMGVSTDSRHLKPGQLFVALRGEKFDGHAYLADVLARGASAVLVEEAGHAIQPAIVVPDSRRALGELARAWRTQFALPLIAVTGSNGKTTVKEMLASILAAEHGEAHRLATRGNLNNEIGVPLTLFGLDAAHRGAVVELGMNHPGEIAWLAQIAQPTVALVNNAQREHQEFMTSVEAVARENGAVLQSLPAHGVAVFPAADEFAPLWRELAGKVRCMTFALIEDGGACRMKPDVLGNTHPQVNGQILRCTLAGQHLSIQLQVAGVHNARNALAAATCAWAAGCSTAAIQAGLERFRAVKGRLEWHETGEKVVIDDSYNANPDSVRAAIDVLAHAPAPRLLILGDMGEVGTQGTVFHEEIGRYAKAQGIDTLFCLGELSRHSATAFGAHAEHFSTLEALLEKIWLLPTSKMRILVKGSRFMRMERVVEALLQASPASTPTARETADAA